MNKILKYGSLVLLMLISACTIDEIDTFGTTDYVYFSQEDMSSSVVDDNGYIVNSYTFIFEKDQSLNDKVYSLPVTLAGTAKNADRVISIEIIDSLSTAIEGTHFELVEASQNIIPSGSTKGMVNIRLIRTPEMDENIFSLALNIIDNDQLKAGPMISASINYSNYFLKPDWWDSYKLGTYSIVKGTLWMRFMGAIDGTNPWSVEPYIRWVENGEGEQIAIADDTSRQQSVQMFALWLDEGDENGDPYYDENGIKVVDTIN